MDARHILRAIAVLAIVAAIFWMKPDSTEEHTGEASVAEIEKLPEPPTTVADDSAPVEAPGLLSAATSAADGSQAPIMTREIPSDEPGKPPLIPSLALQKGDLPWEKRINEVLDNSKIKDAEKGRLLVEMLPGLPTEARETAAEYAVQRLDDADYQPARNFIVNPTSDPAALTIMWADLMGRPDAVSLPILLQVARNSVHPYAASARENLGLLLGSDFGTDWARWGAAIQQKLSGK